MIRPFPWSVGIVLFLRFILSVGLSTHPYVLRVLLNTMSHTSGLPQEAHEVRCLIGLYLSLQIAIIATLRVYGYFADLHFIPALRQRASTWIFFQLIGQSYAFYRQNPLGEVYAKLSNFSNSVPALLHLFIDRFLGYIMTIVLAIFTLYVAHWVFSVMLIVWVACFTTTVSFTWRRFFLLNENLSGEKGGTAGAIFDMVLNIFSVFLYGSQKEEFMRFRGRSTALMRSEMGLQRAYIYLYCFYSFSFFLLQIGNMYLLYKGYKEDFLYAGDFALVLAINSMLFGFLWKIPKEFSRLSNAYGAIAASLPGDPFFITSLPQDVSPEVPFRQGPDENPKISVLSAPAPFRALHLCNVTFKYRHSGPVFQNFSLSVRAGESIGVIGPLGAGKTTLLHLLMGLYFPSRGKILLNEMRITPENRDVLGAYMAGASQNPMIFNRSIRDNICYGVHAFVPEEAVIYAAKCAQIHSFIASLPQGYSTVLGPTGLHLSVGHKQCILLARIFLKKAPLVILDEAMSQLDYVTKEKISHKLNIFCQKRACVFVSHDTSLLKHAQRILVLKGGAIVDETTYSELIKRGNPYKEYIRRA